MFDPSAASIRVLGVDPGLSRCGVAVLDGPAQRAKVVRAEVVRTPPDQALGDRLAAIHAAIESAVATDRPAALAVERVFINNQARTGVGAIQVVGLVHLVGARHGLGVTELTPSQVKAAVTGFGDADKDQVTFMVQRMLGLAKPPKPADKADALAVALCHLQQAAMPTAGPATTPGSGPGQPNPATAGLPPRLAAALAEAGPGLQAVRPTAHPRGRR
ncbi:Crossover junction endodeoxyribonuclease RuvC [Euzebya pacifica]|uniref:Crossover junction endodeoxyribonuclease RuvC n=1 Tax=Euzebya pacifica TaxID=1608957 RepID=A0A346XVY9_9ACTN|nr:crossover junction endodeoxyribonuclease RuvC [Euzebya pacifica]AXV06386.1 Crossover junction endodeoxyribonuclease RuvC [Euzebya pacifica]